MRPPFQRFVGSPCSSVFDQPADGRRDREPLFARGHLPTGLSTTVTDFSTTLATAHMLMRGAFIPTGPADLRAEGAKLLRKLRISRHQADR